MACTAPLSAVCLPYNLLCLIAVLLAWRPRLMGPPRLADQSEFFARFFKKTEVDDLLHADGPGHFRGGAQQVD